MRWKLEAIIHDLVKLRGFLKKMIIEALKLEEISVDEIDDDAPLFKDGLGLDSIDALELVVAIEKNFDVIIEDEDVGKEAFGSIRILAAFIQKEYIETSKDTLSAAG